VTLQSVRRDDRIFQKFDAIRIWKINKDEYKKDFEKTVWRNTHLKDKWNDILKNKSLTQYASEKEKTQWIKTFWRNLHLKDNWSRLLKTSFTQNASEN
jgi:uncharacterized protein YbbC (DUF1343 family)